MINIERIDELNDLEISIHKELKEIISNEMKEVKEVIVPSNIYDYDISYSVSYDGGNHPEYASDCFANIESIELKGVENVIINMEYGSEPICCFSNQDLFTIAYLIDFVVNQYPIYEKEKQCENE